MSYKPVLGKNGEYVLEVHKSGQEIIHNPLLNKGTSFTKKEREELDLIGLLPPHVATLDEQLKRAKEQYDNKDDPIERYIYLRGLQDRNEILFYALIRKHIPEMMPIIYTPTVGEAVEKHGHIFRNARGLFISPDNVDRIDEMCHNLPSSDISIIVATDSQGILGLGDQGVGGMAIPIGKLSLYSVAAGIHPSECLPIALDVGTNNDELLNDPFYLGNKHKRLTGKKYSDFIKTFVEGVKRNFPKAILQWEDFSKQNAFTNMDVYREALSSFNDDIQGTGAVTLGGLLGAMKIKKEKLTDQKFAVYGAGAGGIGIARQIKGALVHEGLSVQEAADRVFVLDSHGLITDEREDLDEYKKGFEKSGAIVGNWLRENLHELSLKDVIQGAQATVLIGASTRTNAFDKEIVGMMMKNTPEPVIFPLSNPTSKSEADPREVLEQTGGAAIVASGSPFPPAKVGGREYVIGQGNNAFIFPGVGLGAIAAKAKVITDGLFAVAAKAMAEAVPEKNLKDRCVFPPIEDIFEVSRRVAVAVYNQAIAEGVGVSANSGDSEEVIRKAMWTPAYPKMVKKP
ncbi:MAG: NAD-dependent malic enzyme [Nitrospinota bacterium]